MKVALKSYGPHDDPRLDGAMVVGRAVITFPSGAQYEALVVAASKRAPAPPLSALSFVPTVEFSMGPAPEWELRAVYWERDRNAFVSVAVDCLDESPPF